MQSTHLTCEGAIALAEIIEDNPVIQRIDLRDNNILVAGLLALALSMKNNNSVTQLDLDDAPKKKLPAVSVCLLFLYFRVAVISAQNHKRQRRNRQPVTAKREKSQTPKVLTAILTLPKLT